MNEIKKYYWLCSYPLEDGSIVNAGNWGRILKQYNQMNCNWVNVSREYIFENIRIEKFADKPSRLKSTFLCETPEIAKQLQQEANRNFDLLYEVEIVGADPVVFKTDWQLANFPQIFSIQGLEEQAELYWKGENMNNAEILTENKIKIVRQIK